MLIREDQGRRMRQEIAPVDITHWLIANDEPVN